MPTTDLQIRRLVGLLFAANCLVVVSSIKPLPHLSAGTTTTRAEEYTSILIREKPECELDCRGAERRYFCASNGRTLESECKVRRAQCQEPMLEVTPGKCKDSNRCEVSRNYNLRLQIYGGKQVHVPTCEGDGTYASEQCDMYLAYCWCVTPLGNMIRNSTLKIGSGTPCSRNKSKKKGRCKSTAEKAEFALSVRDFIEKDYRRKTPRSLPPSHRDILAHAVMWKLDENDKNNDSNLSKREMGKLLRPYRKKLSRSCKKMFFKHCDFNQDKKVSSTEWKACLGAPMVGNTYPPPKKRCIKCRKSVTTGPPQPKLTEILQETPVQRNEIMDPSSPGGTIMAGTAPQKHHTCRDMREEILRNGREGVHVPQCKGPNMEHWTPVQCNKKTGYCFCVLEENGQPIKQASVPNGRPNCKTFSNTVSIPIPGCPSKTKIKFLRQVRDILIDEMLQTLGGLESEGSDPSQTRKERAARWYFGFVDENHDRVLSRQESKKFKKLLTGRKLPKKCLRKFTQHCDRDRNKKTTQDEFIACLEVRQQERYPRRPSISGTIHQLRTDVA